MSDRSIRASSDRRPLGVEVWIVLGLSLGASGVYAVVSLVRKATLPGGIGNQTATLNGSQDNREVFDFVYQVLGIGFNLVPVALALYLLSLDPVKEKVSARLGLDRGHARFDVLWGMGLAAAIGLPGLGNFVMGLVFGYWFHRTKRVMPLVIAHTILDVVAFVGYLLLGDSLGLT